jgi:hypothetical protein
MQQLVKRLETSAFNQKLNLMVIDQKTIEIGIHEFKKLFASH